MGQWSHTPEAHWRCALTGEQQRVLSALQARALGRKPHDWRDYAVCAEQLAVVTGLDVVRVEVSLCALYRLGWAKYLPEDVDHRCIVATDRPTDDEQRFLVRALQATRDADTYLQAHDVDEGMELDHVLDAFEASAPAPMAVRFMALDGAQQLRVVQLALGHFGDHLVEPSGRRSAS